MVLDDIAQQISYYLSPVSELSDKDRLTKIIAILESRHGYVFMTFGD